MNLDRLYGLIFPNSLQTTIERFESLDELGAAYHHYEGDSLFGAIFNAEIILKIFQNISQDFVLGNITYKLNGEECRFFDKGFEKVIGCVNGNGGHFYGELRNFMGNHSVPVNTGFYGDFKLLISGHADTNKSRESGAYFFVLPGVNYIKQLRDILKAD